MQARYYDPILGRFLSIDPVTFMQSGSPAQFNRYAYKFNDPVNLIDPDGQNLAIDKRVAAGAAIGQNCSGPCGAIVEAGAAFTPIGP